jgi:hypothetical protein
VREADNLITFTCRMSWKPGSLTSWNPLGHTGPVTGLLSNFYKIKIKIMEEGLFKYYLPIAKCIFRRSEHTYKPFILFPYLTLRLHKYEPMLCPGSFLVFNHNIYGIPFFSCAAINRNFTAIYVPSPNPSL